MASLNKKNQTPAGTTSPPQHTNAEPIILSELIKDKELTYKLLVLLYNLSNIKADPLSVQRTNLTVDELYISSPYFSETEARLIKNTIVDHDITWRQAEFENEAEDESEDLEQETREGEERMNEGKSVEQCIKARLSTFFEKRKASGDARPCGPHDMLPIYVSVFGIEKSEVEDERFLGRCGVPKLEKDDEGCKGKKGEVEKRGGVVVWWCGQEG